MYYMCIIKCKYCFKYIHLFISNLNVLLDLRYLIFSSAIKHFQFTQKQDVWLNNESLV